MHYNFARPHQTLKGRTPAMAAGVADHMWTTYEIAALLDAPQTVRGLRRTGAAASAAALHRS